MRRVAVACRDAVSQHVVGSGFTNAQPPLYLGEYAWHLQNHLYQRARKAFKDNKLPKLICQNSSNITSYQGDSYQSLHTPVNTFFGAGEGVRP